MVASAQERSQVISGDPWGARDIERRENGGQDIDGLHRRLDATRREPRGRDDERHPHLLFVDRRAVVAPVVLAELFAMIGGDDHHRVGPAFLDGAHDLTDAFVGRRDLAVVPIDVSIPERVLGVRHVGLVRFEQMHPQEEPVIGAQPFEVTLDGLRSLVGIGEFDARVFEVEPAIAKGSEQLLVDEEDGRRVERRRAVPVSTEEPRERIGVPRALVPTADAGSFRSSSR